MENITSVTVDDVKAIVERVLDKDKDIFMHSERVHKNCKKIAKKLEDCGIDIQKEKLFKAAYLHDIGKAKCRGDGHSIMSIVLMYDLFDCEGKNKQKNAQKICSMIISHKGHFYPRPNVAIEAAILRMADKIDKYYKTSPKKAKNAYNKSIKKIECYFKEGCT